ncbi:MAG: 3-methylitaconate isomerase [Proteobacteria bacterium]|nr:3-methylitaconate isomerase [Pseudomonadota bacterium]
MTQLRIPAVYMRGGTSKGVFFLANDLPIDPQQRDRVLLRVIGSPDPYGKHIDGMGGATSSTSKVVLISKSMRPDCDVDYLFGALAVANPTIDWSGNCGNLSAAVGPFAIRSGLLKAPTQGWATVRIWQANIGKMIISHVPMCDGAVQEEGDFELDGVTFPAAEIKLEFLNPGADDGGGEGGLMFPTGKTIDWLDVPGVGRVEATLINAGLPTIFVEAVSLGFKGSELQSDVNPFPDLLERAEKVRVAGATAMGLVAMPGSHTPKISFVARSQDYTASDGRPIKAEGIGLLARIFSMGALHHAMTGTGAVAIAAATAIPGTIPHRVARKSDDDRVRFGHPSGALSVGAEATEINGEWVVSKVLMSRSARRLMEGWVLVPQT